MLLTDLKILSAGALAAVAVTGALLLPVAGVAAEDDDNPLMPVVGFDVNRYAGKWYEIVRLPNRFQRQCASDVTAEYAARPDGLITVVNRCRTDEGKMDEARGVAEVVEPGIGQLDVTFVPRWLSWLPFTKGDYWVLELDPAYRYALVGTPGRDYLWVLSREPKLPSEILERLLARAREDGFDLSKLVYDVPSGGVEVSVGTRMRQ
ncbi:MAG: lipocalin family protein [Rhodocyclaceae bacterium]